MPLLIPTTDAALVGLSGRDDADLEQRAEAIGSSAAHELGDLHRHAGVNLEMLSTLSNNLGVARDWRFQPSMEHFWSSVAEPRYDELLVQCRLILSDAGDRMVDLLEEGGQRQTELAARQAAVEHFARALELPQTTLRTGEMWHRHLQLRAIARVAYNWPRTYRQSSTNRYRQAKLEILDSSPWCYQDRLLSAFEAAHRELVDGRSDLISELRFVASADGVLPYLGFRPSPVRSTRQDVHT